MTDSTRTKIGFFAAIALGSALAVWLSKKDAIQQPPRMLESSWSVVDTGKPEIRIHAQNAPVFFENNLENSLQRQKPPTLKLKYVGQDGSSIDLHVSREIKQHVERLWRDGLYNSLASIRTTDRETRINIDKNYLNDTAIFIAEIERTSVSTPDGAKRLEREAAIMARTINELAIRRLLELHEMSGSIREPSLEAPVSQ